MTTNAAPAQSIRWLMRDPADGTVFLAWPIDAREHMARGCTRLADDDIVHLQQSTGVDGTVHTAPYGARDAEHAIHHAPNGHVTLHQAPIAPR